MKGKDERLSAIRQLIKSNSIQNQDELLDLLQKEGFDVTQATLSRDLRFLQVVKIPADNGTYIYSFGADPTLQETSQIYIQDFLRGYLSVETSGNMVVIKTYQGHANTVCNAIDNLDLPEILGTVAGENTMFAVLREGVTKEQFEKSLREQIPGVEIN
ncbi:MAG: arginine repressor [Treponema sp.]|nr:arginine repressor [Treponema sp.]